MTTQTPDQTPAGDLELPAEVAKPPAESHGHEEPPAPIEVIRELVDAGGLSPASLARRSLLEGPGGWLQLLVIQLGVGVLATGFGELGLLVWMTWLPVPVILRARRFLDARPEASPPEQGEREVDWVMPTLAATTAWFFGLAACAVTSIYSSWLGTLGAVLVTGLGAWTWVHVLAHSLLERARPAPRLRAGLRRAIDCLDPRTLGRARTWTSPLRRYLELLPDLSVLAVVVGGASVLFSVPSPLWLALVFPAVVAGGDLLVLSWAYGYLDRRALEEDEARARLEAGS